MNTGFTKRKALILKLLMEDDRVSVSDLSKLLNVTPVTARSDPDALEKEGLLILSHGGATPAQQLP